MGPSVGEESDTEQKIGPRRGTCPHCPAAESSGKRLVQAEAPHGSTQRRHQLDTGRVRPATGTEVLGMMAVAVSPTDLSKGECESVIKD